MEAKRAMIVNGILYQYQKYEIDVQNLDRIAEKIKSILRIIDDEPIFFEEQIKLSDWISKYYLCSQGEALFTMLPSGKRETSFSSLSFEEDEKSFSQKKSTFRYS